MNAISALSPPPISSVSRKGTGRAVGQISAKVVPVQVHRVRPCRVVDEFENDLFAEPRLNKGCSGISARLLKAHTLERESRSAPQKLSSRMNHASGRDETFPCSREYPPNGSTPFSPALRTAKSPCRELELPGRGDPSVPEPSVSEALRHPEPWGEGIGTAARTPTREGFGRACPSRCRSFRRPDVRCPIDAFTATCTSSSRCKREDHSEGPISVVSDGDESLSLVEASEHVGWCR